MSFISLQDIIVMSIGCIALIFWLVLFIISKKNNSFFDNLNEKEYPLKDLYSMGYTLIEKVSYDYKGKFDRQLRADLGILYEEKFVEYYIRVVYAQSVTLGLLIFVSAFILYGLSGEILILFIMIMMSGLSVYYFMTLSQKKIRQRSEMLLGDFSEIVSKLALLINAGMIMREAWSEVANAGEGTIYEEMRRACDDMNNGVSESEAIRRFGVRCVIPEIKKFSSTIIQGMEKGNKDLAIMLRVQSDEVWEAKKQRVKKAGAQANTKLMIPMFIMFIGVLIMIVIPIFSNMGI
ncbi:MAG: type II secretion system F family protein [Clostridia bacterium]|nr:type II secretion system F family protein [Clostridia bacterium]